MVTRRRRNRSQLLPAGLALCALAACHSPHNQTDQSCSLARHVYPTSKKAPQPQADADNVERLTRFLAGKELRSACTETHNLGDQEFLKDGVWKGNFVEIDLVHEEGKWSVERDSRSHLSLCVTRRSHNGRQLSKQVRECHGISPDYSHARVLLTDDLGNGTSVSYFEDVGPIRQSK